MSNFNYSRARSQLRQALDKIDEIESREKGLTGENAYRDANSESFGRVPETCPIIEEIVNCHISKILHGLRPKHKSAFSKNESEDDYEIKESPESNALIAELKEKITLPFRKALTDSLEQKYAALETLSEIRESSSVSITNVRTIRPERKAKENVLDDENEQP